MPLKRHKQANKTQKTNHCFRAWAKIPPGTRMCLLQPSPAPGTAGRWDQRWSCQQAQKLVCWLYSQEHDCNKFLSLCLQHFTQRMDVLMTGCTGKTQTFERTG